MSELINFFKLDAYFDPATSSTCEVVQTSDPAQSRQQLSVEKKWTRKVELGRGSFGTVWLERDEKSKDLRAVKQISKKTPSNPFVGTCERELLALSKLSKRRDLFVHFHGWFENEKSVFLAMEYFELGDLENYITPKLTENDAKMIGRQLLEGLQVLNKYGMAHRDLKPENIFVARDAPNWWIKIGDFGFSRYISPNQKGLLSLVGTPSYMAPEILLDHDEEEDSSYTLAVDIWSLGCVIFRLLTRQLPFIQGKGLRRYWSSKTSFPTNILVENQVSEDGVNVVSEMMKPNPVDRITVTAALRHPWIFGTVSEDDPLHPGTTTLPSASDHYSSHESLKDLRNEDVAYLETRSRNAQRPTLGETDPDSHSMNNLTDSYRKLDGHKDEMQPNLIALETQGRTSGEENLHTPHSLSKLANWNRTRGQYQEAVRLDQNALEIRERILGKEHPDTLQSMSDLARSYRGLRRYQEATQIDRQVLEARKRILGEEHPDTLCSMSDLARSYCGLSRHQEAMQLDHQALEVRRRILGQEHPDTLHSMGNLASSYLRLHRYRKAMQLDQEALDIRERILGKNDPDILHSMSNLASSYRGLGRYQEAMQLDLQALEARRRILGEEDPDTLRSMSSLARSYRGLRRYRNAMQLDQETLETRRRILGEEHLDTLQSMSNLARSYFGLWRYHDVIQLDQQVFETRKRILGDENPDTFQSMHDLAISHRLLGNCEEAMQFEEKALESRRRILGEKHIDTIRSAQHVDYLRSRMKKKGGFTTALKNLFI